MLARCSLALAASLALGQDDFSLVQHSYHANGESSTEESAAADFNRVMRTTDAKAAMDMAPQLAWKRTTELPEISEVVSAKKADEDSRDSLSRAWKQIADKTRHADVEPQELLRHAKMALMQTGAMEQMRKMAVARANATSKGAVPLDSMSVGFRTSVAPWNNLLRMFAMPLVKASFTIFTNFFGPQGNAARLCMGAQVAADSTYGVHTRSEFGGINVWMGPAKWDNVPGWSFGTSGGIDDVRVWDVSDFGWTWTLAKVPETVGFHWDVLLIDDETIHAGMMQTGAEKVEAGEEEIPRHGSTWVQHVWCSPHWENTPLVLPDDLVVDGKSAQGHEVSEAPKSEAWDPESEAV